MSEEPKKVNWTANSLEREVAHARQVISTAKLVVTFVAAIAATFVATTMQAPSQGWWNDGAAGLMAISLGLTIRILMIPSKPHRGELDETAFTEATTLLDQVHCLLRWQLGFSAAASLVAAVGLLSPDWH
jgi:hypothetical protein